MFYDIYTIKKYRDECEIINFIQEFIPEPQMDVEQGECLISGTVCNTAINCIRLGCNNPNSSGGVRINGTPTDKINGGWIYFNSDGSICFGLTVAESESKIFLELLKEFTDSQLGYIAGDCPPADSFDSFKLLCDSI